MDAVTAKLREHLPLLNMRRAMDMKGRRACPLMQGCRCLRQGGFASAWGALVRLLFPAVHNVMQECMRRLHEDWHGDAPALGLGHGQESNAPGCCVLSVWLCVRAGAAQGLHLCLHLEAGGHISAHQPGIGHAGAWGVQPRQEPSCRFHLCMDQRSPQKLGRGAGIA